MKEYHIDLLWDNEACVWVATSKDKEIEGLILESGSLDALIERVKIAIPELLGLNHENGGLVANLNFVSKRSEMMVY